MKTSKKKQIKLLLCCVLGVMLFSACSVGGGNKVDIYYIDPMANQLRTEQRKITTKNENELIQSIILEINKGPKNQSLINCIPKDVEIKSAVINDRCLQLDVSSGYNNLSARDELFMRAALVFTFTELEFIDSVAFTVEGQGLLKVNGEPMGEIKGGDIILDNKILSPAPVYMQKVIVYFSDDQAMHLVPEECEINVNPNEPIEKYIVEQIILGPQSPSMIATVPKETKIRDVETRENICYVDLSQDFILKTNGGSSAETMAVYSIVNSLTENPEIEKVQFLIEGERKTDVNWHLDLSVPIERMDI